MNRNVIQKEQGTNTANCYWYFQNMSLMLKKVNFKIQSFTNI